MKPAAPCPTSIMSRSRLVRLGAVFLTLASTTLSTRQACADHLDAALKKHAPEVMKYLSEHHCKNVGILKFRVKKGNQPVSFKVGPLNDNVVQRLEIALIDEDSSERPIGIIRDANRVATSRKLPRYDKSAGQSALFDQKYPLYWGNTMVHPDLFLTGIVTVPPDLKSATVTIEAFGPTSPKQDKVVTFTVKPIDRSLLADLNEGFQIASRQLKRRTRNIDLDEDAVEDAADNDKSTGAGQASTTQDSSNQDSGSKDSAEKLLEYEIRYDGKAQPVTPDPSSPGELHVREPNENEVVTIFLRSLATEKIGLVLMVNGKSTLYEQEDDPDKCLAWVLSPGHEYSIQGYQQDNQTRKPFRVLSDADSAAAVYSANTGLIKFHIFRSGGESEAKTIAGNDLGPTDDPSTQAKNISLRGLSHAALVKSGHTRSLADLKKEIRKQIGKTTRRGRGLIAADANAVAGAIQNDELKNPVFVQSIVVRYYKPKGS